MAPEQADHKEMPGRDLSFCMSEEDSVTSFLESAEEDEECAPQALLMALRLLAKRDQDEPGSFRDDVVTVVEQLGRLSFRSAPIDDELASSIAANLTALSKRAHLNNSDAISSVISSWAREMAAPALGVKVGRLSLQHSGFSKRDATDESKSTGWRRDNIIKILSGLSDMEVQFSKRRWEEIHSFAAASLSAKEEGLPEGVAARMAQLAVGKLDSSKAAERDAELAKARLQSIATAVMDLKYCRSSILEVAIAHSRLLASSCSALDGSSSHLHQESGQFLLECAQSAVAISDLPYSTSGLRLLNEYLRSASVLLHSDERQCFLAGEQFISLAEELIGCAQDSGNLRPVLGIIAEWAGWIMGYLWGKSHKSHRAFTQLLTALNQLLASARNDEYAIFTIRCLSALQRSSQAHHAKLEAMVYAFVADLPIYVRSQGAFAAASELLHLGMPKLSLETVGVIASSVASRVERASSEPSAFSDGVLKDCVAAISDAHIAFGALEACLHAAAGAGRSACESGSGLCSQAARNAFQAELFPAIAHAAKVVASSGDQQLQHKVESADSGLLWLWTALWYYIGRLDVRVDEEHLELVSALSPGLRDRSGEQGATRSELQRMEIACTFTTCVSDRVATTANLSRRRRRRLSAMPLGAQALVLAVCTLEMARASLLGNFGELLACVCRPASSRAERKALMSAADTAARTFAGKVRAGGVSTGEVKRIGLAMAVRIADKEDSPLAGQAGRIGREQAMQIMLTLIHASVDLAFDAEVFKSAVLFYSQELERPKYDTRKLPALLPLLFREWVERASMVSPHAARTIALEALVHGEWSEKGSPGSCNTISRLLRSIIAPIDVPTALHWGWSGDAGVDSALWDVRSLGSIRLFDFEEVIGRIRRTCSCGGGWQLRDALLEAATVLVGGVESEASVRDSKGMHSVISELVRAPMACLEPVATKAAVHAWGRVLLTGPEWLTKHLAQEIGRRLVEASEKGVGIFQWHSPHSAVAPSLVSWRLGKTTNDDSVEVQTLACYATIMAFVRQWQPILAPRISEAFYTCAEALASGQLSHHPHAIGPLFSFLHACTACLPNDGAKAPPTQFQAALAKRILRASLRHFEAEPTLAYPRDYAALQEPSEDLLCFASRISLTVECASASSDDASWDLREPLKCLHLDEASRCQAFLRKNGRSVRLGSYFCELVGKKGQAVIDDLWKRSPAACIRCAFHFPRSDDVISCVKERIAGEPQRCTHVPEGAILLAEIAAKRGCTQETLNALNNWAPLSIAKAISLLNERFAHLSEVKNLVMRSLKICPEKDIMLYLPQLVQSLRFDSKGQVETFLVEAAKRSTVFATKLIWILQQKGVCELHCKQGEEAPPWRREAREEEEGKSETSEPIVKRSGWKEPEENALWKIVERVRTKIKQEMVNKDLFERVNGFMEQVTSISGVLKPFKPAERRQEITKRLREIEVPGSDIFFPTDSSKRVTSVIPESGRPLQSAAKVPIMVSFNTEQWIESEHRARVHPQACIFKVGDDCRQDVLALQLVSILRDAWKSAGLPLRVVPYGVIPTGFERGIIEVVPNVKSRDELGALIDGGLLETFKRKFGSIGSESFERARRNFMLSTAGYAVASYIMNSKDRHNGNILFDNEGNVTHIDFGFILEISPGGNLGFETASFKLSHEMTQILDPSGNRTSSMFHEFADLVAQGFLVARRHKEAIVGIFELQTKSGLPCFQRGKPIRNLERRFLPHLSDRQAAAHMRQRVHDAYAKWTTGLYDIIQYVQQGIRH